MRITITHVDTNEKFETMDYDMSNPVHVKFLHSLQKSIFDCLNGIANFVWLKVEIDGEAVKRYIPRTLLMNCEITIPDIPELEPPRKPYRPQGYQGHQGQGYQSDND